MIHVPILSRKSSAEIEDCEHASEWLGGEAWVNPVPTFFGVCENIRHSVVEPAASDWIPV